MNDLVVIEKPPPLPDVVESDLVADFMSQLGEKTRVAYMGDLRDFARTIGAGTVDAAVGELLGHGLGAANLLALRYKAAMMERKLAPRTIARRLSALRSIAELAATLGRIEWTLRVKNPKFDKDSKMEGPGRDGWLRIARHLAVLCRCHGRRGFKGARDLAICRLSHDLMLRRNEVIGLDLEHVEFLPGDANAAVPFAVWILGKARTNRKKMELPPETAAALAAWLKIRGDEIGPVFCPLDHALSSEELPRLTGGSVARIVGKAGRGAGLSRQCKPHGLRHEGITRAAELGVPLMDIQLAARHENPSTTQGYIDRVADPQPRVSRLIAED